MDYLGDFHLKECPIKCLKKTKQGFELNEHLGQPMPLSKMRRITVIRKLFEVMCSDTQFQVVQRPLYSAHSRKEQSGSELIVELHLAPPPLYSQCQLTSYIASKTRVKNRILGIRHVLHSCTEKEDTSESGVSP